MELNKIIHGDCFEVLKSYPDNFFDAVITDPPYKYLKHKLDSSFEEEKLIEIVWTLLKEGFFVFFGRGESFYKLNFLASEKKFKFKEEIVWDKMRCSSPVLPINRCHETIAIYQKGKCKLNRILINKVEKDSVCDSHRLVNDINRIISTINNINTVEDLIEFKKYSYNIKQQVAKHKITKKTGLKSSDRGCSTYKALKEGVLMSSVTRYHTDHYNYEHPTQKPLELMKRLIELTTPENGIVLDPFAGSFTTAIACLETGRRYVCIEKEKDYFEIGKNRIEQWHLDKELEANKDRQLQLDVI